MSASSKIPAKHVLRSILRSLRVNTAELPAAQQQQQQPGSRSTIKYVLDQYRSDKDERNESNDTTENVVTTANTLRDQELRKMAYEYMILRRDIEERSRLQKLDTGAENKLSPREMSRRAAARAGLELPKLNPDVPE